jgi:flagellar biosynthesis/type III secretory pathway M-ring protein FliF/YscJ
MNDALAWLIAIAVIVLIFWALARENSRKRNRSVEEFERELSDTRESMLRAGLVELDKFVGDVSGKRAAVEYIKDEEEGQTRWGGKSDEPARPAEK